MTHDVTDRIGNPALPDASAFAYDGQFREARVQVGEVSIQYSDWNADAGRPMLMIHGFNVQGHTWDPIAASLSVGRRVICPDLRGHGGSSWAESGYRVKSLADDLAGLLDHLGVAECDVVGHSLGARVGIALAGTWSGRVNHLVLSDAGPEMASGGIQRAAATGAARVQRRGFNTLDEARALYLEMHPEWLPVFRELHVRYQLKRNWADKWVERSDPEVYWITRSAGAKDNAWLWELARGHRIPVLLLWGARSAYFNEQLVERYRSEFPDFHDAMTDTGHYVPRERPEEFCDFVRRFVAGDRTGMRGSIVG